MKRRLLEFKGTIWLGLFALSSLWLPAAVVYGGQPVVPTTGWSLAWHPDGTILAVGANLDGTEQGIRLFDFAADKSTWIETSGNVLALSWSPDGTMLAGCLSSSPGYRYLVWDATTLAQVLAVEQETELDVYSVSWSPDSARLAMPGAYSVRIWDVKSATQVATLSEYDSNTESVDGVAWYLDGTRLLVAQHQVIRLWEVSSQTVLREYRLSDVTDTTILALALSPTGDRFAIGSSRGSVFVFSTDTGKLLDTLRTQDMAEDVFFLDWSPLGDQLIGSGHSGPITIWSLDESRIEDTFPVGTDIYILRVMRFSPYGGRLAYGGQLSRHTSAALLSGSEQSLLDGAARIIVPDPSLERLATIQAACAESDGAIIGIAVPQREAALDEYIAQVEAVPVEQLPPGCAADLVAVARALQSQ